MTQQWKLVPVEPTDDMIDGGCKQHKCEQGDSWYTAFELSEGDCRQIYAAMLDAAPTHPASAQDDAKDERQAFEAAYAPLFKGGESANMPLRASGEYVSAQDQIAWVVWRKARASVAAPAAGDARAWQGLTDAERDGYVGELVDYGTDFVSPLYSVVESIEKRLREKNAAQQGDAA